MNKEKLREIFINELMSRGITILNRDGNSVSNFVANFWLSILDEEKAEIVKWLKSQERQVPKDPLDITPREQMQQMVQLVYRPYVSNEEVHNQAIQSVIEHIEK